jgi:mannose-6-phosphate isomerase-like protein (cupin superfamily)
MKTKLPALLALGILSFAFTAPAPEINQPTHESAPGMPQSIFTNYRDFKWAKILPDLGDSSPEICILHIDPKTQATKLMIRTPKAIHVRKHWHSANETHTILQGTAIFACDGKRAELEPGSFNYMPAKMIHEAWLPAGSLTFITVDGPWDIHWTEGAPTAADLK